MGTRTRSRLDRAALPALLSLTVFAIPAVVIASKLTDVLTSPVGGVAADVVVFLVVCSVVPVVVSLALASVLVLDRVLPGGPMLPR